MYNANKITTSKRIIAFTLFISQVLTSCINFNVPSKQELTDVEKKAHQQQGELEPTKKVVSTKQRDREISSIPLTDEEPLTLVDNKTDAALIVSQTPVADPKSSVIKRESTKLFVEEPIIVPSNQLIQKEQPEISSRPSVSVGKHHELSAYRKHTLDKRTRQTEVQTQVVPTSPQNPIVPESIIEELALLTFTAQGGHQLNLMVMEGQLIAVVDEQLFIGFSRPTLSLPVYIEPGFDLVRLKNPNKVWQQAHIEVIFPERGANGKGYVYIGKRGGMGGGNKGGKESSSSDKGSSDHSSSRSSKSKSSRSSAHQETSSPSSHTTTTTSSSSSASSTSATSSQSQSSDRHVRAFASTYFETPHLPTYSFHELPSHISYREPHVDLPSFDSSHPYSSFVEASERLHSSPNILRPPHGYSFVRGSSSTCESSSKDTHVSTSSSPSHPTTGNISVAENKQEISSSKQPKTKAAITAEVTHVTSEVKQYLQERDKQSISNLNKQAQQARGEQLLKQVEELKQKEERAYQAIDKAYIIGENSEIGDKILLDDLMKTRAEINELEELKGQLSQSLASSRATSMREPSDISQLQKETKYARKAARVVVAKGFSKQQEEKAKEKELASDNKREIPAPTVIETPYNISLMEQETIVKGPIGSITSKNISNRKTDKQPSWQWEPPEHTTAIGVDSYAGRTTSGHTVTSSTTSSTTSSSSTTNQAEITKEWFSLLAEVQAQFGHTKMSSLAEGLSIQEGLKTYEAKVKSYEKYNFISRTSIQQVLGQLEQLATQVEEALDNERYNAVIGEIKQVLDRRIETINKIQDGHVEPAIIIATAQEIKPHVEAAIKHLEDFKTKQDKRSSIENLRQAKTQLEAIIRDYTQREILLNKYKAAVKGASQYVQRKLEGEQGELAKRMGKPIDKYEVIVKTKPGITIQKLQELFPEGEGHTCDPQKILDTLDITVNILSEEGTDSSGDEEKEAEVAAGTADEKKEKGKEKEQENKKIKTPENYDLPDGMRIPHSITLENGNTIKVTFGQSSIKEQVHTTYVSADRLVDKRLIPALIQMLNIASKTVKFSSIHISATTNGHDDSKASNHRVDQGARALDISRIDGKYIEALGPNNAVVITFQNVIDELPNIWENFGPCFLHKQKKIYIKPNPIEHAKLVEAHRNHIHFSITRQ